MERHIKAKANGRYQQIVAPGTMRFLEFARLQLKGGEQHSAKTGEREYVLDIFSGTASISIENAKGQRQVYSKAGGRPDVFSGPPVMVYIPIHSSFEITAASDAVDIGIFSAPSATELQPRLMEAKDVTVNRAGRDNWQRTVYSALDQNVPAERLLAGETLNPSGNWSSYPPHKHDRKRPPNEAVLEEVYFFRVKPSQGFGFIWTYTASDDPEGFSTVFVVRDGDTVLLPKGYHPVVAAPGYELHYTWVLAGEERRYGAWSDDPQHAWVKNQPQT
ncbi:MAG TPA: 5-deoxy-glucuronate isomerase [Terriglobia bacterium]|jgi:5-deoxy-glucuronate isomerase|nr:5-deoxy-glucuronate isomerase [Terriglobia bacterium]